MSTLAGMAIAERQELREQLLRYLRRGRANARTGAELARLCGYNDDRQVRRIIRAMIAEGIPVAASTGTPAGFYIADSRKEVEAYLQDLRGRLLEDATRRRDFKRAARPILQPEQLPLRVGQLKLL